MIGYHGTTADFGGFDEAKLGSNPDNSPNGALGVWVARDAATAAKFGGRLLEVEVADGAKVVRIESEQMMRDHNAAMRTDDPIGFFHRMRAEMVVNGYGRVDVVEADGTVEMSVITDLRDIRSVKEVTMEQASSRAASAEAPSGPGPVGPITTRVLNKHKDDLSGSIYGGRGSPLGNPYPIDEAKGQTRDVVIMRNAERARDDEKLMALWRSMKGKSMVCFCAPKPCHLDVVGYVAEGIESDPVAAAKRVLAGETLAVYKANREKGASVGGPAVAKSEEKAMAFDFSKLRSRTPEERAAADRAREEQSRISEDKERLAKVKHTRTIVIDRDPEFRMGPGGTSMISLHGKDERGRELRAVYEAPFYYERADVERLRSSILNGAKLELGGYFRPHQDSQKNTHFTLVATQIAGEGLALKGADVSPPFARMVSPSELIEAARLAARADSALREAPKPESVKLAVDAASVFVSNDSDGHNYVQLEAIRAGSLDRVALRIDAAPGDEGKVHDVTPTHQLVKALIAQRSGGAATALIEVAGHSHQGPGDGPAKSMSLTRFAGMDVSRMSGEDTGRTESVDFAARNLPVAHLAALYPEAVSVQSLAMKVVEGSGVSLETSGPYARGAAALDAAAMTAAKAFDESSRLGVPLTSWIEVSVDGGMIAKLEAERAARLAAVPEVFSGRVALLVTKEELALGGLASDGSVTPASRGADADKVIAAVSETIHAIAQPEFARGESGRFEKTGKVDVGLAGAKSLLKDFGDTHMRNVYLDPEALNRIAAAGGEARGAAFTSLVRDAVDLSAERRKDRSLVSGKPARAASGVER